MTAAAHIESFKRRNKGMYFEAPRKCWRCLENKPRAGGEYQPGSDRLHSGGWWCADCVRRAQA